MPTSFERRPELRRGAKGADVRTWQGVLVAAGHYRAADVDGDFGRKTEKGTVAFQIAHGLPPDGIVNEACWGAINVPELPPQRLPREVFDRRWKLVQAKNYQIVNAPRTVTLITMHSMQHANRPDTAEGVAAWFAGLRGPAPDTSAHVCCDEDSIVQCVLPNDIAWAAKGGNAIGYHCEQAGYAEWPREKWLEADNRAMIRLMASHVRLALAYFELPAVALTEAEVAAAIRDSLIAQKRISGTPSGVRGGICQHNQITRAWQAWTKYGLPNPRKDSKPWWPSHVDCGDGYPMDVLLGDITSPTEPAPAPA